ncbi:choline-binding transcriptional repressor BetI [Mesorhizobium sp. L-8-3]|uniref:choline-binding transcriptional repressor BetI n=1 Tax=Mesorhizobium sp. L-8-3 TaxID=2744522 RepID=UPI001926D73D|nr:transcriptional regulator BetI [Mesorhizobium sp. L-8-3]BCH21668.1 HTH-type transcriptional regulator BetI [Mesorhizobium sp. L-8-3]
MALTKISEIRRRELRRAAVEVMRREGAAGTTLEKVAQEAGASKGILLHYFRNKQELFEEAMREANAGLRDDVVSRLKRARSPIERIWAIVEANLGEHVFKSPNGHAWLSLCAEVPREPQLARLQSIFHSRMHSNLMSGFRSLVSPSDAESLSLSMSALIDGLWVRLGIGDQSLTSKIALSLARDMLANALPNIVIPGAVEY